MIEKYRVLSVSRGVANFAGGGAGGTGATGWGRGAGGEGWGPGERGNGGGLGGCGPITINGGGLGGCCACAAGKKLPAAKIAAKTCVAPRSFTIATFM